jgi:hypothetical protein
MSPISMPAGDLVGRSPPEHPAAAGTLASYVGVYANAYFGEATIREVGDHLELSIGPKGTTYELSHWDGATFSLRPSSENEPDGSLSSIVFEPTGEMKISYLDQNGFGLFIRR